MSAEAVPSQRRGTTQTLPPLRADAAAANTFTLWCWTHRETNQRGRVRHRGFHFNGAFLCLRTRVRCSGVRFGRTVRKVVPAPTPQGHPGHAGLTKPVARLAAASRYRFLLYCLVKRLPHFDIEPTGVFAPTLFSANPSRCNLLAVVCAQIVLINICASLIYFDPFVRSRREAIGKGREPMSNEGGMRGRLEGVEAGPNMEEGNLKNIVCVRGLRKKPNGINVTVDFTFSQRDQ